MPRAGAGFRRNECRVARRELSGIGVEVIDEDLIDAQIADEGKAVVGTEGDATGMRSFLPLRMHAAASMLPDISRFAEFAVDINWQHRDIAAVVIGDEQ